MPGSINANQLGNMAILNPNIATSVALATNVATTAKPVGIMTSSAMTSQAGSGSNGAPGFITTTLRHVTPHVTQGSVAQNAVTVQSQPTAIQVSSGFPPFCFPSFIHSFLSSCREIVQSKPTAIQAQ